MAKRKKRLKKRIESLKEQIRIHELKREQAEKEGKIELADYYKKELGTKKKTLEEAEDIFDKK